MKCECGGILKIKDTRGNDYHTYRRRECDVCGKKCITEEVKMDFKEGLRLMRRIHYLKYQKEWRRRRRKYNRGRE